MARTSSRSKTGRTTEPPATWDEKLIQYLLPRRVELGGLLLIVISILTLIALIGLAPGTWINVWARYWWQFVGWSAYPLWLLLGACGLYLVFRRTLSFRLHPVQLLGTELILLALLPLSYLVSGGTLERAAGGRSGGLVAWALVTPVQDYLGALLTGLLYLALLGWGVILVSRLSWHDAITGMRRLSARLQRWAQRLEPPLRPVAPPEPPARSLRPGRQAEPDAAPMATLIERDALLPPLDLLVEGATVHLSDRELESKKSVIERTLRDFGLRGEVTEIRRGPAVTQFGVTPGYLDVTGPDGTPKAQKVRISQIAALRKDFALALAVPRLRIAAPVPGRGTVGIEVPNSDIAAVRLRTVLESPSFYRLDSPLALALGQGVSGAPIALDLAKMPHLLIAGTTGSGKSVCLNAFISCLVFNNTPEQVRLVMIDPKKVELIRFNGLPHLLGKVETEHERVTGVLRWLITEMDRRYEAFAHLGARHLEAYNEKIRQRGGAEPLPYIAVFVDELADLMAIYGDEVERAFVRLAQMARATGIHLVLATQRPSTDVITGLIKANFPARISFAVASNTDSRVILDTVGAEQLMGRGDMLFLSPEASEPVRVQGVLVDDNEIDRIVAYWQKRYPGERPEAPWERLLARQGIIAETDDLLEEAIALAKKVDTISTSLIQRRLRVGYPRAARLMEALYELDLVEDPKEGGRTRRTFVGEDDDPLDDLFEERL
ncbi:MAG: DNA translocase FtsK [Chloroflexi bacterium]|mgnify:CR=1 FL=1|nr:DNA translocase FtsK [Chloroflexota bacterium]